MGISKIQFDDKCNLCLMLFFQCFSNKILMLYLYLKNFISLKSHSELATHRGEPVTLPLNILWNVIFSIVVFSLAIIIIVQKQQVLMYIYTCIIVVMVQ